MLDLPPDLYSGRYLCIDTVGKCYVTDHALVAHCETCHRSDYLDLVAIIERKGHAWPIAQIKARCSACGRRRIQVGLRSLRRPHETHALPYPGPPVEGQESAWEAEYEAYRARRSGVPPS